uniref:Protein polybromo-1 n=1 Tax=Cacopsylla melanoneura TaxID=428564 RepID=A0A8D8SGT3_9HEMI
MGRKRRASSVTRSIDDDDDSSSHTSETPTMQMRPKRKKIDVGDAMQQVYDVIRNFKKEDGSLLCDPFIRIPKKRQEPSYHEVVTNPIDFIKIQQKLKTDEYDDMSDFQADVELLVKNAKTFYKRNTQEHRDAGELMDLFIATRNKLISPQSHEGTPEPSKSGGGKLILKVGKGGGLKLKDSATPSTSGLKRSLDSETEDSRDSSICTESDNEPNMQCEELFTVVMSSTDADNRPLHEVFQLLPSKKRYPEYYDVIDIPIDLRTIARRIQGGQYASLGDMEKDLILMTKNACTFNEPGSQIYKDAKALKKLVQSKKIEIESGTGKSSGKSERIRSKRMRGGAQSVSAITAALLSEEDDDESDDSDQGDEEEAIDLEDPNNPLWQLYDAIRNAKTQGGGYLSEPFLKLPAKRYNPDYYRIIKNPRSLVTIGKTLKAGHYSTLNELTGELNLMFENAKKFNPSDSRLYRDAVKLQKLMQRKVQEVLDREGRNQYDEESESEEEEGGAGGDKLRNIRIQHQNQRRRGREKIG